MVEPLETRRLFHTFTLSKGLLTLITHTDSETIGLRIIGNSYIASIDEEGVAEPFPAIKVKRVLVQALEGDDSININPDVNVPMTIQAGDGNDTIFAGAGPTRLEGDGGDDVLVDGGGDDTFAGGEGNDTADFSARTENLVITLDDVANDGAKFGVHRSSVNSDIETVMGGTEGDSIVGSNQANVLMGNGGGDVLVGLGGNDTLSGGGDADLLDGGAGADFLVGSAGTRDKVVYLDRKAPVALSINGLPDDGEIGEHDNISGSVERLVGSNQNDTLVGNGRDNLIDGRAGNDLLMGGSGNDTIVGGLGADTMQGQGGNDLLVDSDGLRDTISGGSGIDTLNSSDADLDLIDTIP